MPTQEHDVLVSLFRDRPELVATLLDDVFDVEVPPDARAEVKSGDFTASTSTEYRADAVVTLEGATEKLAVVIEIQRNPDDGKQWSWPVYLATLRASERCPAVLVVVCPRAGIADRFDAPIEMGHPGWTLHPLIVGPKTMPAITDPQEAIRSPEMAVLSTIAHRRRPDVVEALVPALESIGDYERFKLYSDFVLTALPAAARKHMEDLMSAGTYEYQSEFIKRFEANGEAKGEAKGEARSVLKILTNRGVDVPDDARERVLACQDLDQLDTWLQRSLTAKTVDDLFA